MILKVTVRAGKFGESATIDEVNAVRELQAQGRSAAEWERGEREDGACHKHKRNHGSRHAMEMVRKRRKRQHYDNYGQGRLNKCWMRRGQLSRGVRSAAQK